MAEYQSLGGFLKYSAALLFFFSVAHTFSVKRFRLLATSFPKRSPIGVLLFLLSEVELVFGAYALVFLALISLVSSKEMARHYLSSVSFVEPFFVFVVMTLSATNPVTRFARLALLQVSRRLPFHSSVSFYVTTLVLGPLLGSFITEPAAMTVTALLLRESFYERGYSSRFLYSTLGLLFVNVSIGGTLTHFAAPPVLMVASKWQWNTGFMFFHFGFRTLIAILLSTALVVRLNLDEIKAVGSAGFEDRQPMPAMIFGVNAVFLFAVILSAHHPIALFTLLCFFLAFARVFEREVGALKLKEAGMVAFFLSGLAVLGSAQGWWLEGLLSHVGSFSLFIGATALTAIIDNAALTYLGSQVTSLSEPSRYLLVAGAVAGGGLTVIANAPNPIGHEILADRFGEDGVSPLRLFLWALPPTLIAMVCYSL